MRILLALDLNSHPEAVLDEALLWAERLSAQLDLIYVDSTPNAAVFVTDPTVAHLVLREQEKLQGVRRDRLTALRDRLPPAIRGHAVVATGDAATTLHDASQNADLLIVATHGRAGLAHLWLGSVAERVVRGASCPVLVLRLPKEAA